MSSESQPIIIIGMHRSGTTMITSMLNAMGLFIGRDLEHNSESLYFIKMNDRLLYESGAAWDNPAAIKWLYQSPELLQLSEDYIRARLRGMSSAAYLGWDRYLQGQRVLGNKMKGIWGWKDPRTTFTLPFWLRLFPQAKIINVYRNGVPVAASLRVRERKNLALAQESLRKRVRLGEYSIRKRKSRFVASNRSLILEGGFSLWEEYVRNAQRVLAEIPNQSISLRYETFLQDPANSLIALAEFCGLDADRKQAEAISSRAKPERGSDFMNDKELALFYESVKESELMKSCGY